MADNEYLDIIIIANIIIIMIEIAILMIIVTLKFKNLIKHRHKIKLI